MLAGANSVDEVPLYTQLDLDSIQPQEVLGQENRMFQQDSFAPYKSCRYVPKASLRNITVSNHRLHWAVDGKRLTAPLPN